MEGLRKGYSIRKVGALNFLTPVILCWRLFPFAISLLFVIKIASKTIWTTKGSFVTSLQTTWEITATFDIVTFYAVGNAQGKQGNYLKNYNQE